MSVRIIKPYTTIIIAQMSIILFWQMSTNVIQVYAMLMPHVQILLDRLYVHVRRDLAVMDQHALVCVCNLIFLIRIRQAQFIHFNS